MKKNIIGLLVLLAFQLGHLAAQSEESFSGEIMDSHCAMAGSHADGIEALKKKGVADANSVDCTRACLKKGAKYVLYDSQNKIVYQLDNQRAPNIYAGEKATVVGTLNKETNTIQVKNIRH